MNKNQRFVITIGRERGSGGRMVGKELARRFHIHYYDREILACASKELNVDEAYLASIDERSMNFMQNVFPVAYGGNSMAFNYVTTEAELIGVQSRLICEFASSRSCVIVGRCADYLLRDNPNCIRIFLSSDMEDRIDHIAEIYGGHDEGTRDKGVFGFRVGPAMASVDFFYITVTGQGTHGARPHLGHDPVPVAAEIVTTLQTLVSRRVDPIEKAVVSVCSINAGNYNAPNVIPAFATMSGTVRTFNEDVRKLIATELPRIAEGVAQACGCKAEVTYEKQTPAVINHPLTTKVLCDYVRKHFGDDAADENFPISMGGDDFAEYQFKVPGSIIRVGVRDEAHPYPIHNNRFDFNDEVSSAWACATKRTPIRSTTTSSTSTTKYSPWPRPSLPGLRSNALKRSPDDFVCRS